MADFPNSIFSPVTKVNRPGFVYGAAKTTRLFAEDTNNPNAEIVAVENELGTNPSGATNGSIKLYIDGVRVDDTDFGSGSYTAVAVSPQLSGCFATSYLGVKVSTYQGKCTLLEVVMAEAYSATQVSNLARLLQGYTNSAF